MHQFTLRLQAVFLIANFYTCKNETNLTKSRNLDTCLRTSRSKGNHLPKMHAIRGDSVSRRECHDQLVEKLRDFFRNFDYLVITNQEPGVFSGFLWNLKIFKYARIFTIWKFYFNWNPCLRALNKILNRENAKEKKKSQENEMKMKIQERTQLTSRGHCSQRRRKKIEQWINRSNFETSSSVLYFLLFSRSIWQIFVIYRQILKQFANFSVKMDSKDEYSLGKVFASLPRTTRGLPTVLGGQNIFFQVFLK